MMSMHVLGWEEGAMKMQAAKQTQFGLECARSAILVAMHDLARKHEAVAEKLTLFVDPLSSRSKGTFTKGELIIVCCSTKIISHECEAGGAGAPPESWSRLSRCSSWILSASTCTGSLVTPRQSYSQAWDSM